jgi:hypothetical protein
MMKRERLVSHASNKLRTSSYAKVVQVEVNVRVNRKENAIYE